jgi:hypothetical protein
MSVQDADGSGNPDASRTLTPGFIPGDPAESLRALLDVCRAVERLDQVRRRAVLWAACERMLDQPKRGGG